MSEDERTYAPESPTIEPPAAEELGPAPGMPAPLLGGALIGSAGSGLAPGTRMTPPALAALHARVGNAVISRMLARQHDPDAGPGPTDAGTLPAGGAGPTPAEEIETFRGQTFAPLPNFHPASGIGQFDATLDPAGGRLTITLKVGFTFVNGDPARARGFRAEELAWTPAEQTQWQADYIAGVSSQFSDAHQFHSTKPGWDAVTIATTVSVVASGDSPHFLITVAKYPRDAPLVVSSICPPGTHHVGDTCAPNPADASGAAGPNGTAEFDSNDLRPESKLDAGNPRTAVPFTEGGSELTAAGTGALAPIVTTLQGNPAARVILRGRASTTKRRGATDEEAAIRNMDLARLRSAAVQAHLVGAGIDATRIQQVNFGDRGADATVAFCRVDAQVATQETQDVAVHETGHMLGLGDEYLETGEATGAAVDPAYGAMVQTQTGAPVTKADDASAMSLGSTVRPHHYSSFLEALKRVSAMEEWAL